MSSIPVWSHRRSAPWQTADSGKRRSTELYPDVEPAAIEDALDLERQLAQNLRAAIAA